MIDVEQTIISQYGTSATITKLIRNVNEYLDPRADFDMFFDFVWNVETAQGFGLDIWGRIVGIARELTINAQQGYFGFSVYRDWETDRKSTRLNSSHSGESRMPSSA